MIKGQSPVLQATAIRWLPAQNQNAQQVPAFGLVRVVSVDPKGLYTVDQPNTDGQQVFGTNFVPIAASMATPGAVTNDWPWWALYEAMDGVPAVGDTWGAGAGSWKLRKGKAGFQVVGVDTTRTLAKVVLAAGATAPIATAVSGGSSNVNNNTVGPPIVWPAFAVAQPFYAGPSDTRLIVPANQPQNGVYRVEGSIYYTQTDPTAMYGCAICVNGNYVPPNAMIGGPCEQGPLEVNKFAWLILNPGNSVELCPYHDQLSGSLPKTVNGQFFGIQYMGVYGQGA